MDRQDQCLSCGHALGAGRFCVNCGHPRGTPTTDDERATAERPAIASPAEQAVAAAARPVPPPPVYEAPRPARFPLFADESPTAAAASDQPTPPERGPVETGRLPAPPPPVDRPRRSATLVWAAAAVAVIVLFGAGGALLLSGSGDESASDAAAPSPGPADPTTAPPEPDPPVATPSDGVSQGDDQTQDGPVDLASVAEATPPDTADPSRDVNGNAVRYEAFNMLDGQPDTAWRMPGDASGQEIVFRLGAPTTMVEVGLINGYAKVDPGYDGYAANRRITSVEWVFGDGTVVPQSLGEGLALQSIPIDDVVTDTVTLRILDVSKPAKGPAGRDYTAISDVALVGSPA